MIAEVANGDLAFSRRCVVIECLVPLWKIATQLQVIKLKNYPDTFQ
jgi:hypothetical protein